jgi:short subunit dehydrogenase-like uncharacterized protein
MLGMHFHPHPSPAAAMGSVLIERLRNAGQTFKIL